MLGDWNDLFSWEISIPDFYVQNKWESLQLFDLLGLLSTLVFFISSVDQQLLLLNLSRDLTDVKG